MSFYIQALFIAIPIFSLFIVIEWIIASKMKLDINRPADFISSLSSGMSNITKDGMKLSVVLISYSLLVDNFTIYKLEPLWLAAGLAFLVQDFSGYWMHRLNHRVNIFWNRHVIHHSSEEFNLACALRQSISNFLGYGALFLIPAAIFGIPHSVIVVLLPLHLFGQFWYHTRHIGKLGILEYIFVTPSQHRVHHAINPIYIDKNLGGIFCVWDRWFGTFQEELDDEPPVYGVLKPVSTWNPILINFTHVWGLILDFFRTKSLKEKFLLWFMPTGYRPKDVIDKYPINKIDDVHNFNKYSPPHNYFTKSWVLFHWLCTNILVFFFLAKFSKFDANQSLIFCGIIFISIFSYSAVMDGYKWAYKLDLFRNLIGLFLLLIPSQFEFYNTNLFYLLSFGIIYFTLGTISSIILNLNLRNKYIKV